MKFVTKFFAIFMIFFACNLFITGQSKTSDTGKIPLAKSATDTLPPLSNPDSAVGCELARRFIDDAAFRAEINLDSNMFFIVRSGKNESLSKLGDIRIKQLKLFMRNHPEIKSVFAVGDKTQGLALIEIYVDGKILYKLPLAKNKGIEIRECIAI